MSADPQGAPQTTVAFERLHRQEEYPGTGVGLAIVRKVAERHGGRAWADSEIGRGSVFYFAVPSPRRPS